MTAHGRIVWHDLTVEHAPEVRDFYSAVVGWTVSEVPMPGYADYGMHLPGSESMSEGDAMASGEMVAGVCHARGSNANIPPQWLMYVEVADVDASSQKAIELGGEVIDGPRAYGNGRFAILKDPAGAVIAIHSQKA